MYKLFLNFLKITNLMFLYLCLDEFYTFYSKKDNKIYIWSAVEITKIGRKFYFYFLSKKKNIESIMFPEKKAKIIC